MEQQAGIHPRILEQIRRLRLQQGEGDDDDDDEESHRLIVSGADNVNRQSVQYLADFLNGEHQQVTELMLASFFLLQPPDGGLNVLQGMFANNTTLTKVKLVFSDFGNQEEASQLIAAIQTNRSIIDLAIYGIDNLEGAVYGNCISGLLQTATHLQRLESGDVLNVETVRTLQPGLRTNRHLKILDLSGCFIRDEHLRLIADALVGNMTMETFDISNNDISSNGLDDITRLLESTRLKKINTEGIDGLFDDEHAMQHFTHVLHQHTSLEELPGLDLDRFPFIKNLLARNCSLRRSKALLALQQRTRMPIGSKSGIWCKAMSKLAPDSFGASAIFNILQTRPAILEKQLRNPASAAVHSMMTTDANGGGGQKRRRI